MVGFGICDKFELVVNSDGISWSIYFLSGDEWLRLKVLISFLIG